MSRAVLISLGGSTAPVVYSLNQQRPECIVFFASAQSQPQVLEVLRGLSFRPRVFEQVVVDSAEDLNACFVALRERLPAILRRWEVGWHELVVDYTGGTKTMSVALVLATVDRGVRYAYVGGGRRDKGGLGTVISGQEVLLQQLNPWDVLALEESRRICLLFNTARYRSALELVQQVGERVSRRRRPFYEMVAQMIEGYDRWDRFDHRRARTLLFGMRDRLRAYAAGVPRLRGLLEEVEAGADFLRRLLEGEAELAVHDLLANAIRRAELEGKYDDAAARLYRALELAAQLRLRRRHGIETSRVRPEQVPQGLREEYVRRYGDEGTGPLRVPLEAAYRLLGGLGDELGRRYEERREEMRRHLQLRNRSILAHGDQAISREGFEGFLAFCLEFLDIAPEDLPRFPNLTEESLVPPADG